MINLWILPYPIFTQTRFGQLKPLPEQNGRPIRSWLLGGLNHPENVGHIVGNPESIPKMWGFTQWPSRRWQASSHNFWALALGFSHEFNQGTDTNNSHDHDLENCLNSFELISGVATSELVGFVISFSEKTHSDQAAEKQSSCSKVLSLKILGSDVGAKGVHSKLPSPDRRGLTMVVYNIL